MAENFELRNIFNDEIVKKIADKISNVWQPFEKQKFCDDILMKLENLGLKNRSHLITENLKKYLPDDYPQALGIIIKTIGPELESEDLTGTEGFMIMPYCTYVSRYGADYFELSINALYELTKRFTAEEAIRTFIRKYPDQTMEILLKWTSDKNVHVRRLVSEGTRPRLPWAEQLPQFITNPLPVLNLLEKLKDSPELYVRRSIANNLNDISKDHPDLVVERLKNWQRQNSKKMDWLIRHATRTLIKSGHPGALELLGFPMNPDIQISDFTLSPVNLIFGNSLEFSFVLHNWSDKSQNLMIDYIIHFLRARGLTNAKVFKHKQYKIKPKEKLTIKKKHPFVKINTRRYYPGKHKLSLQINGIIYAEKEFILKIKDAETSTY